MLKTLLPFILIITAIGLFFGYVNPAYDDVKVLRTEEDQFDQALDKSRELQAVRDKLISRYNTFATADLGRLQKLLPDNVDNVRLILDMDSIASRYGMRLRNVVMARESAEPQPGVIGTDTRPYGSVTLTFSVLTTYDNLIRFLKDLERSLRIVDIINFSLQIQEGDLQQYSLTLRTYWLK